MASTLRLGIVPYINVLPLLEGLGQRFPERDWVRATPRELGGLLAAGEIDVATLPVFEALRTPGYRVVPGCAIACDGPVRSVALFSRVPLAEIRSVILDRSSLTSVHLAQILTHELLEIRPEWTLSGEPLDASFDPSSGGFDAVVAIGDTALAWEGRFPHALDLGQGWKDLTGLPFVFAAWVARPGAEVLADDVAAFQAARDEGERHAYEIARRVAGGDPGRLVSMVDYLARAIRFHMGEKELEAIDLFRRKLVAQGLLPKGTGPLHVLPSVEKRESGSTKRDVE